MKSLSVKKGQLLKEVLLPSSKSYANRALILSALTSESPLLKNLPIATDVTILLECLKKVGLKISNVNGSIKIENHFPECETGDHTLEVGEGGTTARFLATMLLLGRFRYKLILGERLKDRPWSEFLSVARSLGGRAELNGNILEVQGPVQLPSRLEMNCALTTQFATAFQLLAIVRDINVIPVNMQSSRSYWELTERMLSDFKQKTTYEIPLDWSSAGYPMAFAALNHRISFPGLFPDPYQADSKLYDLLFSLGCIEKDNRGITVNPLTIRKSLTIDVSDCLDLVPTLAYLLAHIEGSHLITGFKNLVHKESDRLEEVQKLLNTFGREVSIREEKLVIQGRTERDIGSLDLILPDDHRIVMAGTLFLLHHSGGAVSPMEAVAKSYPDFFSLIQDMN